jgi:dihydrofolate reductase
MKIVIIVATDLRGAIGHSDGHPLWHLSDDLKLFKQYTQHHPIIMGHTTFRAIGRPLSDRQTILLTRDRSLHINGVITAHTIHQALAAASHLADTVYVVGGAEVYSQFLNRADELYLTEVHAKMDGNIFFTYDPAKWTELSQQHYSADETNQYDFVFKKFRAKR